MNEREIFVATLEIDNPEAVEAFLAEACAGDQKLLARVRDLLAAQAEDSFLEKPALDQVEEKIANSDRPTIVVAGSEADSEHADPDLETQSYNSASGEFSLSFLKPSKNPKSLGRLAHYEVSEVIGQGAFGTVLKAFDENLQRVVAIKVLSLEMAATSPPRKRFQREAQSSAKVRHENVVAIYAVEQEPTPYLVMEYIPGKTLQQRLDEHGPLDLKDVLKIGKQIADGLAAAHAEGLIHRDIKPGNILLDDSINDHVKITDFGLARAADDASMTQSGVIAGTPLYMAPEQVDGKKLDQRADLFSLGSVFYQMLTGRPPFRAPTTMGVLKRVTEDTPRSIQELIPETPDWMCEIVSHLHAKDPDDRFDSAQEVSEILGQCLADLEAGKKPEIPNPAPEKARVLKVGEEAKRDRQPSYRSAWAKAVAVLLVMLVGLGITEATGVTKIANTVIRWTTPHGILVVETNDPSVKFAIDGEEITIQGGGIEELRLRPGDYTISATKDGRQFKQEIVSVEKSGRTVVKMRWEPNVARPTSQLKGGEKFALAFDGDGDRVETPISLDVTRPFTVEAFVTVHSLHDYGRQVISNNHNGGFGLSIRSSGKWRLTIGKKHNPNEPYDHVKVYNHVESDGETRLNRRTHVAGVFDGSELRLYVNGKLQSNRPKVLDPDNSHAKILIGLNPEPGDRVFQPLDGTIDEVRISTVARYTGDFSLADGFRPDQHTLALYRFDEGRGDVLEDSSGNGHHGRIVGAKWIPVKAPPFDEIEDPSPQDPSGEHALGLRRFPSGEWIDVISLIEPERDKFPHVDAGKNIWRIEEGALHVGEGDNRANKLIFPLDSDWKSFECELEVTRIQGLRGFCLNLPSPNGDFPILFDLVIPRGARIGGRPNPWAVLESPLLETNRKCQLRVQVVKQGGVDEIKVWKDGTLINEWTGKRERVTEFLEGYPHARRMGLALFPSSSPQHFVFHKIRVKMLDGGTASTIPPRPVTQAFQWPADAPPFAVAPFDAKQAKAHQQAWAKYLGVPAEKEIVLGKDKDGKEVKLSMVLIPPGEFTMGSTDAERYRFLEEANRAKDVFAVKRIAFEGPARRVSVDRPFYLSRHEVTVGQFQRFVEAQGYATEAERDGKGGFAWQDGKWTQAPRYLWNVELGLKIKANDRPVVNVSWNDATAFCNWLSQESNGHRWTLPTEAQWEYACRAGTTTAWSSGDTETVLRQFAQFNARFDERRLDVGKLKPNALGLYDMHGNVWEWCAGPYSADSDDAEPITHPQRGGSWDYHARHCRSAFRSRNTPESRAHNLGFRVAAAIPDDLLQKKLAAQSGPPRYKDNGRSQFFQDVSQPGDGKSILETIAEHGEIAGAKVKFIGEFGSGSLHPQPYWDHGARIRVTATREIVEQYLANLKEAVQATAREHDLAMRRISFETKDGKQSGFFVGYAVENVEGGIHASLEEPKKIEGSDKSSWDILLVVKEWPAKSSPDIKLKTDSPILKNAYDGHLFGSGGKLAVSPDGKLLATTGDAVRIWNVEDGKEQNVFELSGALTTAFLKLKPGLIAIGTTNISLADNSPGKVLLWDFAREALVQELPLHAGEVHSLALSPDGKQLAIGAYLKDKGQALLWNLDSYETTVLVDNEPIGHVAFTPDGKYVISGSTEERGTVRVFESSTGKQRGELRNLLGVRQTISDLAASPDSQLLAVSGGNWREKSGVVQLVKLPELTLLGRLSRPVVADIRAAAFSPNGRLLAMGSGNGEVLLVDLESTKDVIRFTAYPRKIAGIGRIVCDLRFTSDGKSLFTAADGESARLWELPERAWPKETKAAVAEKSAANWCRVKLQYRGSRATAVSAVCLESLPKTHGSQSRGTKILSLTKR